MVFNIAASRDALLWESGFLAFLVAPWNIVFAPWRIGKLTLFKCRCLRYSHFVSKSVGGLLTVSQSVIQSAN